MDETINGLVLEVKKKNNHPPSEGKINFAFASKRENKLWP